MAASKSFVPQHVPSSRPVRRFTLEQANRALPYVSRIVKDIVSVHQHIEQFQIQLESSTSAKEQAALQTDLDGRIERLQNLVDELSDVGCELKDFNTGLIDFVARHEGRDVYLCWKLGEEKIGHWHELQSGVAGRKSISTYKGE